MRRRVRLSRECTELGALHRTHCAACSKSHLDGVMRVVEYVPDSELRDSEQVPLLEDGGIDAFYPP